MIQQTTAQIWRPLGESNPCLMAENHPSSPLDEGAPTKKMVGKQGFEPRFRDPESRVLPLDDFPTQD